MDGDTIHLASLAAASDRIVRHLRQQHDTALVGPPGCGTTSALGRIKEAIAREGYVIAHIDLRKLTLSAAKTTIDSAPTNASPLVVVIDHAGDIGLEHLRDIITTVKKKALASSSVALWCGAMDARLCQETLGLKLCSVPSAHVTHPLLSRDELLSVYDAIASQQDCRWGEGILYCLLDLCGTDLSLVESLTEYLHGDWSTHLSEGNVWDRITDWLKNDDAVNEYRSRLHSLSAHCEEVLELIRFGGKPLCPRSEVNEETDDGLRRLCLDGFIIPNLLPGFYQLRNLMVRLLLDESAEPELLFRRATNERAAALLQDTEMMLRQVLASLFNAMGRDAVRQQLENMQQPGVVIENTLNGAILKWSREKLTEESHRALVGLIAEHRDAFKARNSVWASAQRMMQSDNIPDDGSPHLQAVDYLTLDQLGTLVINLSDNAFPRLTKDTDKKQLRDRWLEGVAKIRRLRNQVAHLRNVGFQDMEDLSRTLDRMRRDVIDYGGWKDGRPAEEPAAVPVNLEEA